MFNNQNEIYSDIVDTNLQTSVQLDNDDLTRGAKDNVTKPILLWLKQTRMSFVKQVNKKQVELFFVNPDSAVISNEEKDARKQVNLKSVNISKRYLLADQHTKIASLDASTINEIRELAVPPFYKRGLFLIPLREAFSVKELLEKKEEERKLLVDELVLNYDDIIKSMIDVLGPIFNYADYPPVEQLKEKYSFSYKFLSFDTPLSLKTVSLALYEKEKVKSEEYFDSIRERVKEALTVSYKSLVEHLIDKLSAKKNGMVTRFTEKTVTDLTDFLEKFKIKNTIANDDELAELVNKAENILKGVDVKDLRKNKDIQDVILSGFSEIQENLENKVKISSGRKFNFDDLD